MHTLNSATELNDFFKPLHFSNRSPVYARRTKTDSISPLVDISENTLAFFIHAELPGVKQEDVKITVDKNILTFSGKKISLFSKVMPKEDTASSEEIASEEARQFSQGLKAQAVEREFGRFTRSFTLPDSVDSKSMNAKFSEGVLIIEIPKKEEEIQKSFEVEIS